MNLYTSENNHTYRVLDIPQVAMLNTLGVFKGGLLIKKATYKFGGPALVEISGREVAIGKDIALNIEVEVQ